MTPRADIPVICLFSVSRTGSNYLANVLRMRDGIDVYAEIFHPQAAFSFTEATFDHINTSLQLGFSEFADARNPDLVNWLRSHPAETIAALRSLAASRGSSAIYLKIFNNHLLHQKTALRQIAAIPGLVPVILQRRCIDSFISQQKAAQTNSYTRSDTTQIKPEITLNQYRHWAEPRKAWYQQVIKAMQATGRTVHMVTYEADIDIGQRPCFDHWMALIDTWTAGALSSGHHSQNRQSRPTIERQDHAATENKVANWHSFKMAAENAGLLQEVMSYLVQDCSTAGAPAGARSALASLRQWFSKRASR